MVRWAISLQYLIGLVAKVSVEATHLAEHPATYDEEAQDKETGRHVEQHHLGLGWMKKKRSHILQLIEMICFYLLVVSLFHQGHLFQREAEQKQITKPYGIEILSHEPFSWKLKMVTLNFTQNT